MIVSVFYYLSKKLCFRPYVFSTFIENSNGSGMVYFWIFYSTLLYRSFFCFTGPILKQHNLISDATELSLLLFLVHTCAYACTHVCIMYVYIHIYDGPLHVYRSMHINTHIYTYIHI